MDNINSVADTIKSSACLLIELETNIDATEWFLGRVLKML